MVGVWSSTRKTNQELNKEKDYYEEVMRQTAEGKISMGQLNAWLIQVGLKNANFSLKSNKKETETKGGIMVRKWKCRRNKNNYFTPLT